MLVCLSSASKQFDSYSNLWFQYVPRLVPRELCIALLLTLVSLVAQLVLATTLDSCISVGVSDCTRCVLILSLMAQDLGSVVL